MLDFRNINTLWASVLVETLVRLGLTTVITSPGSRSTPLTVAFARHPRLVKIPILDERSASFFALGHAKASGQVTVLVCTSGTAGANYFPAIIEAFESGIPLLVLTADRPPELQDCASGQTIDQQKLFGDYVRGYAHLSLPEASFGQLRYLRQAIVQAWQQSRYPVAGPVHLNCPFRDPLAPISTGAVDMLSDALDDRFFEHLDGIWGKSLIADSDSILPPRLGRTERGIIIVGSHQPLNAEAYCKAIAILSKRLGWPVLADGLSPLRNYHYLDDALITTYDLLLRQAHHAAALIPEQVLQIGALPTSKILRQWLEQTDPQRWVVDFSGRNKDPLHGKTLHLPWSLAALAAALPPVAAAVSPYGKEWLVRETIARQRLTDQLQPLEPLFEGKVSWLLSQKLSPQTPLMVANSMPVRDMEWFWAPSDRAVSIYCSRGANGIDGTLSTAMGIAQHHRKAVLLTGDLALLHDSNGLLNSAQRDFHLTVLLINNQGGGIFEMLPIAQFEPPFETFFATPQQVDFAALATAHGASYEQITSWQILASRLTHLPERGIRLLELRCDRRGDAQQRAELLSSIGDFEV